MRTSWKNLFYFILSFAALMVHYSSRAQCSAVISSYPYNEGFEANNGNWFPSSTVHWAWGTPVGKAVIPGAGSGSKCWIAGGLSGSSYPTGSSELVSPCFNFSTLTNPEISFKVFWETELRYDGVTLQYSLDNAATWITLGDVNTNDPCAHIENWFNYSAVNYLGNRPGWSGNIQTGGGSCLTGQGSGQWLTARHNLQGLGGAANVIFKFVFGAGLTCNGFDGFAIDDIQIAEIPPSAADFSFTCAANNAAQFTNAGMPCQSGWSWDFGDPASGAANTSTLENPAHTFSAPGNYTVSLLVNYASGLQVSATPRNVTIPDVSLVKTDVKCNGDQNGSIAVQVNPPGSYTYSWNTSPAQFSSTINNLSASVPYTVIITAPNTCPVSVSATLAQPALLSASALATPAVCGNNNGSINASVSGGTVPYVYEWSNGSTDASLQSLTPGFYNLAVHDANGCIAPAVNNIEVIAITREIHPHLGNDTTICPGQTLSLHPGAYASYTWQDNSTFATYPVIKTGVYSVQVVDSDGCTGTDSVKVTVDCRDIYFPSGFTPGADGLNSTFNPLGDITSLKNYQLIIYNRFAEIVFSSSDPFKGWDGNYKGKPADTGAYVWTATYAAGSRKQVSKKGTIMLIH